MTPILLNQAKPADLAQLPGIGPALAARIIEYRDQYGPLTSLAELTAVKGISPRILDNMSGQLSMAEEDTPTFESTAAATGPTALEPAEMDPAPAEAMEAPAEPGEAPAAEASEASLPDDDVAAELPLDAASPAAETQVMADAMLAEEAPEATTTLPAEETLAEEMPADDMVDDQLLEAVTLAPDGERDAGEPALTEPFRAEPAAVELAPMAPAAESGQNGALPAGCHNWVVGLIGGLVGAALLLAILAFYNGGTLQFADANNARRDFADAAATQTSLQTTLDGLSSDLNETNAALATLSSAHATVAAAQAENAANIATVQADTAALASDSAVMATRIDTALDAAEDFGLFLDGLSTLLDNLNGTATPTPATTMTPTPVPTTGTGTATSVPETAPTRTPRPTATPFALATPAE